MIVLQTKHKNNIKITNHFAKGCNGKIIDVNDYLFDNNDIVSSYGILRGTGKIFKNSNNFYYIDHGYLSASKRAFSDNKTMFLDFDGYFRVVKNDYIGFKLKKYDDERIKKLNLHFSKKRTSGEYIILSEPSSYVIDFFNLTDWVSKTIKILKKYTDRKIFLHNKSSKIPLDFLLEKAWAFVSLQSTAGFKAMLKGVPAHFTYESLKNINSLKEIENGCIDQDVFNSLSYNQWTLKEFESGEAWEFISKN